MNIQQAFDRAYDRVDVYPNPPRHVAFTDRVDPSGMRLTEELGLIPVDLLKMDPAEAISQLEGLRVSAVLGRGGMDAALRKKIDPSVFWRLRESGVLTAVRLGNGVGMDSQEGFDNGVIVERTPNGNAQAVRIWQDLMLLLMLHPDGAYASRDNPAAEDNRMTKEDGRVDPLQWDRTKVHSAVNPASLPFEEAGQEAQATAEFLRGKKVAVIGAGIIGREVIQKSPFLRHANVVVYDPFLASGNGESFTVAKTKEEALQNADVVILHPAGDQEVIGYEELRMVKREAIFCNLARGGCVNPRALYRALENRQISKAGLDVQVAEKKEVAQYLDVPSGPDDRQPGHWAVLLRGHSQVIATNHSGASEIQAERINAEDGVRAAHRLIMRGEIINAIAAPDTQFPYGAFVEEREGAFAPKNLTDQRVVLQWMHDGAVADIIVDFRIALRGPLGGAKLNQVSANMQAREVGGRRNTVDLSPYDLPITGDRKLLEEIIRAAESVRGVRRARVLVPHRKAA
ncbi:hypothetical protein HYW83_04500 [Candidatus Peregrinibacteria bacterium]|nr:hypothetical protein [Candidatus Peregrinibacteria bacterium]